MEDPAEAHKRRGAPFTFWAEGLIDLIKKIRQQEQLALESLDRECEEEDDVTVYAPSFDHAVKDPIEKDIRISV